MKWQTMETAPKDRPILAWCKPGQGHRVVVWFEDEQWEGNAWWCAAGDPDETELEPMFWMELPKAPAPPGPGVYEDCVLFPDGEMLEIDPDAFARLFFRECNKAYGDITTLGRGLMTLEYRGLRFVAAIATVVKSQTSDTLETCLQVEEWKEDDSDHIGFCFELGKVLNTYLEGRQLLWVRP